jgi:uncharacterized protein YjbI with pentapeptide repeats
MTWIPSWSPSLGRSKQPGRLKRLGRRLNQTPPWWVSQILVATLVSLIVGGSILFAGNRFTEHQARHAERLENLRFVRDRALNNQGVGGPFAFSGFDLQDQSMDGLKLPQADFVLAKLRGAKLQATDLTGADFWRADLRDAALGLATLTGAHLTYTDASRAAFPQANLHNSEFLSPNLHDAELEWADLSCATLTNVDFTHADLLDANLTCATIAGSDFTNADLEGADLSTAHILDSHYPNKFDNIYYDASTKWPAGFHPPPSRAKP